MRSHALTVRTLLRGLFNRRTDVAMVITACAGVWVFWSPLSELSTLSWWYDRVLSVRAQGTLPDPDYDLDSLPWQKAEPRAFDVQQGQLTLVTNAEPFAYQAFATVHTNGARAADIQFEADVESGGVTIGLLQSGKWIAVSSSPQPGVFADTNSTLLGYSRSVTLMIANNNPAGETRVTLKSLRLYLRK
jgi:hypothetical protein